jgi:hypothetical protein
LQATPQELEVLVSETVKTRQETALLYFAIADYHILKTTQYANESDQKTAWDNANKLRNAITGESTSKNDSISPEQILEYQKQRELTGISFTEFVENNKLNIQS